MYLAYKFISSDTIIPSSDDTKALGCTHNLSNFPFRSKLQTPGSCLTNEEKSGIPCLSTRSGFDGDNGYHTRH